MGAQGGRVAHSGGRNQPVQVHCRIARHRVGGLRAALRECPHRHTVHMCREQHGLGHKGTHGGGSTHVPTDEGQPADELCRQRRRDSRGAGAALFGSAHPVRLHTAVRRQLQQRQARGRLRQSVGRSPTCCCCCCCSAQQRARSGSRNAKRGRRRGQARRRSRHRARRGRRPWHDGGERPATHEGRCQHTARVAQRQADDGALLAQQRRDGCVAIHRLRPPRRSGVAHARGRLPAGRRRHERRRHQERCQLVREAGCQATASGASTRSQSAAAAATGAARGSLQRVHAADTGC